METWLGSAPLGIALSNAMFPMRVGNWQFGPAYMGPRPLLRLASPGGAALRLGYSNWAALRPCSLARQDFHSTPHIATDRAPAGPNLNPPTRRNAASGGTWSSKVHGSSGAELPMTYPYGEHSIIQRTIGRCKLLPQQINRVPRHSR